LAPLVQIILLLETLKISCIYIYMFFKKKYFVKEIFYFKKFSEYSMEYLKLINYFSDMCQRHQGTKVVKSSTPTRLQSLSVFLVPHRKKEDIVWESRVFFCLALLEQVEPGVFFFFLIG
jgi:hypothetical protein